MDDRFLTESRREPEPGFARTLRAKLREDEIAERASGLSRWRPALAAVAALVVAVALFTLPAVRATAQNLLDLFRVRDFAIVEVDAARMEQLKNQDFDPRTLLGGPVEKLQQADPPQYFTSIDAAVAAAGFSALRPTALPRGLVLDTVVVSGDSRERITVNTQPLRQLMDTFDIRDLTVPPGLDGQQVTIHMPKLMVQRYRTPRGSKVGFVQANSPEVSLPPGVDLARLGEIGLRLMGTKRDDAHRLAQSIDWRSTLLVPVAGNTTTFQQLTINGSKGVYIERDMSREGAHKDEPGGVVLWSHADHVYSIAGSLDRASLVTMAESVR